MKIGSNAPKSRGDVAQGLVSADRSLKRSPDSDSS